MHHVAMDRLSKELDVVEFVRHIRLTRFLTSITLNKTQKNLAKLFNKYHLHEDDVTNMKDVFHEDFDLLFDDGFDPDKDKLDAEIYK